MPCCSCFGRKKEEDERYRSRELEEGTLSPTGETKLKASEAEVDRKRDVVASPYNDQCELLGFKDTSSRPSSGVVPQHDLSVGSNLTESPPVATSSPLSVSSSSSGFEAHSRAELAQKRREFFKDFANGEACSPRRHGTSANSRTLPSNYRTQKDMPFPLMRPLRPVSQPPPSAGLHTPRPPLPPDMDRNVSNLVSFYSHQEASLLQCLHDELKRSPLILQDSGNRERGAVYRKPPPTPQETRIPAPSSVVIVSFETDQTSPQSVSQVSCSDDHDTHSDPLSCSTEGSSVDGGVPLLKSDGRPSAPYTVSYPSSPSSGSSSPVFPNTVMTPPSPPSSPDRLPSPPPTPPSYRDDHTSQSQPLEQDPCPSVTHLLENEVMNREGRPSSSPFSVPCEGTPESILVDLSFSKDADPLPVGVPTEVPDLLRQEAEAVSLEDDVLLPVRTFDEGPEKRGGGEHGGFVPPGRDGPA